MDSSQKSLPLPKAGSYLPQVWQSPIPTHLCPLPYEPDMSSLLTSAIFKVANLKISRQEQGWCCW